MMFFLFDSFILNTLTTLIAVFISLYFFSISTYDHWKRLGVKFVKPTPFFGNIMLQILHKKNSAISQQEIYNSFPEERYVGMYAFRTPLLMIRDPQLIYRILTKDFSHFYNRGTTMVDERIDLLSMHLVNLTDQRWKSLRSKLTPAFSSGKLKIMCSQLDECANALAHHIESSILPDSSQDVREIMTKFATDVIGSCAFGLQFNSLKDPNSQFRKMGQEIFKPSFRRLFKFFVGTFHPSLPYYLNLKLLHRDVEKFFLDFVKDAVHQREENNIERRDFIQLLAELRKEDKNSIHSNSKEKSFILNDQVLASNVFVFFVAGFETTSSTMAFLLLELAANLSIQDSVRSEIIRALDKHNGELNYDTIKDLPYLEMVISETLRKYPVFSALVRECTETYQVPDSSMVIKKGTKILIPVFAVHHDATNFPNPEEFDPERFSPKNKENIKQGSYIPFGDGPRICIGLRFSMMEMKYAFCKIIPKYKFMLSDQTVYPAKFKKGGLLLVPENGIWLDVHKLNEDP